MKKIKSKFKKYLSYPDGGTIKAPIKATSPDSPDLRAYNDSLQLHNLTKEYYDDLQKDMIKGVLPQDKVDYHINKLNELTPRTDSLVNDLHKLGINYKIKGYNKVPIGDTNGEYSGFDGKLQKVAPMPKQPYFFKQGGKLPKHTFGSFLGSNLGSIASIAGGIGLSLTGGGAVTGIPMILGGASGIAKGAANEIQASNLEKEKNKPNSLQPTYNNSPLGNSYKSGGKLIKYNTGTHASGNDQAVNNLGLPTNNMNDAVGKVQKNETIKDGFVFSDDLGYDKNKNITLKVKDVKQTFAEKSKVIDKKFRDTDEISRNTKNFVMQNIQKDNQKLLDIKFEQEKVRAFKALSRFEKKYGGAISKYINGGGLDLTDNPFGFEQFQDNILGRGSWKPYTTNNLESGTSSASDQYNFAQDILPNSNDGLIGAMGENIEVFPMKYNNSRIATMPLEDRYNEYSKMNSPASVNKSTNLSTPGGEGINYADYLSPALNAGFALYNAFKKPNNYLAKPNNAAINTIDQIEVEPDNTQLYNRNQRTLKAANSNAGNVSPSIRNSLLANNLGIKLNADNEIGFNTQKERLDRKQAKLSLKAQMQANQNQWGEATKSKFYAENAADRQANQEAVMTNLSNAANDISAIGRDKELLTIYKQGLKYFDYDAKTGKYIYKNNLGNVFYSSIPPQNTSKTS